jgi:hypothetical protein
VAPPPGPLFVYGPTHYIAAGALFMTRNKGGNRVYVVREEDDFSAGDDRAVISSDSLNAYDDWQLGAEVRAGMRIGDPWWLTVDVFWLHGFLGQQRVKARHELALAGLTGVDGQGTLVSQAFDDAETVFAGQASTILGTDINVKYWWTPWFYVGAGFRYVRLHENVELTFADRARTLDTGPDIGGVGRYTFDATNNIFAGQLVAGARWGFWNDRVHLSISGTAGAGYNYANSNQSIVDTPGNARLRQEEGQADEFSFIGTARGEVSVAVWPWLRVYAGAQFMYITGVALVQKQFNADVTANEPGGYRKNVGVNTDSHVYYYGGFAGLKVTW